MQSLFAEISKIYVANDKIKKNSRLIHACARNCFVYHQLDIDYQRKEDWEQVTRDVCMTLWDIVEHFRIGNSLATLMKKYSLKFNVYLIDVTKN